jgi:ABC-type Fe3+-hydroxamate transport system substrate-binding protein
MTVRRITESMQRHKVLSALVALCVALPLPAQRISLRDGNGDSVTLAAPAQRVASLVSSAIDIMISLGAADRLTARTRYDTARVVLRATDVGGGLDPSVETLITTRPDLFIAWSGQRSAPVVSRMRAIGVPVYLVDTRDTAALYRTVRDLGVMLGITPRATEAASRLRAELRAVQVKRARAPRLKAVYVISRSPVIISAASSFMGELISVAGADTPFRDVPGEFPTLSLEAFLARDPDVLIVGHRDDGGRQLDRLRDTPGWRDLRAVRSGAVVEVDGEQWGRPTLNVGALVRDLAAKLEAVERVARRRR